MRIRRHVAICAACWLAGTLTAAVPAAAEGRYGWSGALPSASQRAGVSLDEAVRRAEKQFNARVVKAETVTVEGRRTYVLRLVTGDGRVITVRVDAETGSMQ